MSPNCPKKDKIVVLNRRFALNRFPDSMRLSSNIGFSYTRPYENLDTGRILFAPGPFGSWTCEPCLCKPCLYGQLEILRLAGGSGLNFFFRLRRTVARPQRHGNRLLA